jgi:hypothetical protein
VGGRGQNVPPALVASSCPLAANERPVYIPKSP